MAGEILSPACHRFSGTRKSWRQSATSKLILKLIPPKWIFCSIVDVEENAIDWKNNHWCSNKWFEIGLLLHLLCSLMCPHWIFLILKTSVLCRMYFFQTCLEVKIISERRNVLFLRLISMIASHKAKIPPKRRKSNDWKIASICSGSHLCAIYSIEFRSRLSAYMLFSFRESAIAFA